MVFTKKCTICGDVDTKYTLFLFPANIERKTIWNEFCKRPLNVQARAAYLCSKHFEKDYFVSKNSSQRIRLKKNAIPTLYPISDKRRQTTFVRKEPDSKSGVRKCLSCMDNTDRSIPLFRFPSKVEISRRWLSFCHLNENETINPNWRLCGKHFPKEVIVESSKNGRRNILPDSVPSAVPFDTERTEEIIVNADEIYFASRSQTVPESPAVLRSPTATESSTTPTVSSTQFREETLKTPTPTSRSAPRFSSPRFLEYIKTPHLETRQRRRSKYLAMMKAELNESRTKVKRLQVQNSRLQKQVANLKDLMKHLVDKNLLYQSHAEQLLARLYNDF